MNALAPSEFILNDDGSIYHLHLLPQQLAETVILVGDPDRVEMITEHFDHIEVRVRKREFHTQTGTYKGRRMSVISTGIGTDNIDIVLNEIDALVNLDFSDRRINDRIKSLEIIRIGTSGSLQEEIPVDSFLLSELAVGFDSLLHYYQSDHVQLPEISNALEKHLGINSNKSRPYVVSCDKGLAAKFSGPSLYWGFTGTNPGFYGAQGRMLRLSLQDRDLQEKIRAFDYNGLRITNLEMETAGIYGMAKLLGHKAVSLNAIIANRATGAFTRRGNKTVEELIRYTLERLV